MQRIVQDIPIHLAVLAPFAKHTELSAHKIQLCTGVHIHIHVHSTRLWKFCFIFSVHLSENGSLSVYRLVVRERKYIALAVVVHHRKGQAVIVADAVFRRGAEVVESVVHPAHIPFVVKTETSVFRSLCDSRIGGGILCT